MFRDARDVAQAALDLLEMGGASTRKSGRSLNCLRQFSPRA
jgi:hypothetical protein